VWSTRSPCASRPEAPTRSPALVYAVTSEITRFSIFADILRFFAYLDQKERFVREVREFVDPYLKDQGAALAEMPDQGAAYMDERKQEFRRMLAFVSANFPHGFRKGPNFKTTPRIRFEAIAVGSALALRENPDIQPQGVAAWAGSEDFRRLTTSDASNSKPKLLRRIGYVRAKLLGQEPPA
jgi:hypothetical protein